MSILLLFLGLLPIILLPDAFDDSTDDSGNGTGHGSLDVLQPDTDDDTPSIVPIDVDPDTVLQPDVSDDTPGGFGNPVTGPVLTPNTAPDTAPGDAPGDAFFIDGDSSLLEQLLAEQSDATTGIGHLGAQITDTMNIQTGDDDDTFALDADDVEDNGEGTLGSWDGTPIIHTNGDLNVVDGGDGNDTLIFDRADTATGGSGNDTFWLYHESSSGVGHAEVTEFTPGEDFLRVSLNPDVASGTPDISVRPSDNGLDGIVTVNGEIIAVLQGAPGASTADIYVDIPQNIFR